ncbi:MAG: EF-P beta-lysylation protein EpmB [Planctomycetota bacterium]|nr:EF-P beta-lysylation protein EpmB [Planctomycetota bacterium]
MTTLLEQEPMTQSWQNAMKRAIRNSRDLLTALELDSDTFQTSADGEAQFPVFVPLEFLSRMQPGNPNDPLLLQVLPRAEESEIDPDFGSDPVGDSAVERAPGLLHKYTGRVLLIVSGVCGVHCRYCFRRHYPYGSAPKSIERWLPALDTIQNDPSIHEVILSGGDPLTVVDEHLSELAERLSAIPHVKRLRIHTRLPVVIPQRVDEKLCGWLRESRLSKWIVLHINHAQEIDSNVGHAIKKLQQTGATVLNQAVLLRGINDSAEQLGALCERLVDCGVLPYYLHQLDRVSGATHFEADRSKGLAILEQLTKSLPGYAVPKYVQEIAGKPSKSLIIPE